MANTSSRMLRLLSLLQTHRYWPGGDLAERLDVSIRTLRRDIDRLRELGYPVEAQRGVDGGYQLAVGAALPPLVLDDEEAVALTLGLLAVTSSPVTGMAESSVRALTKVVQVMPNRLRRQVDALRSMTEPAAGIGPGLGNGPTIEPDVLTTVAQACRDTERLTFDYTAADTTRTQRLTEPMRLVAMGRRWYLVAYDLTRHDWRSFRLDRLSAPHGTGVRFRPRTLPADDAAAYVRAQLGALQSSYEIEALVQAPAAIVGNRIGRWATIRATGPTACLVTMSADSLEWPAMALGLVGVEFTVLGPDEFIAYLRDWGNRFLGATGASGAAGAGASAGASDAAGATGAA
jgi:predicted DNA-binding transcriptional regulator YafY